MKNQWVGRRAINLFLAVFSLLAILVAVYFFEGYLLYNPCPYCMLQRIVYGMLGILFLIAGLHHPHGRGRYFYLVLIGGVTLLGLYFSGLQSWMQLQPYEPNPLDGGCHQEVATLVDFIDFKYLQDLVTGASGDCHVREDFLGLPIAVWTFISFLLVGFVGCWNNWRK